MTNTAGLVAIDLAAGIVGLAALYRIWDTPAGLWPNRNWSRAAWTVAVVWLNVVSAHVLWPVGAVMALRQAARNRKKPTNVPPPPPFAAGHADSNWWNLDYTPASGASTVVADSDDSDRPRHDDGSPEDPGTVDDWDEDGHAAAAEEARALGWVVVDPHRGPCIYDDDHRQTDASREERGS